MTYKYVRNKLENKWLFTLLKNMRRLMQSREKLFCIKGASFCPSLPRFVWVICPLFCIFHTCIPYERFSRYLEVPCFPFYHVIYQSPELSGFILPPCEIDKFQVKILFGRPHLKIELLSAFATHHKACQLKQVGILIRAFVTIG